MAGNVTEDPSLKRPFVSVSKNGELLPEVKDVIAVIAEHQLVLETGHSSPEESLLLLAEGMTYGADGAGLANLAASIGTFGCTSLNSTTSWPLTHDKVQEKGIMTPATSR